MGVCFGQPVLNDDDKRWSDDEDDVDPSQFDILAGAQLANTEALARESNRERRLRRAVPFEKKGAREAPAAQDPIASKRRKEESRKLRNADAAAGKVTLSTNVGLVAPDPLAGARGGASAGDRAHGPSVPGPREPTTTTINAEALQDEHVVMRQVLAMQKFVEPTEIQRAVWPHALEGKDVVAQAPPGAGKTLAFLLPVAARLIDAGHGRHTQPQGPLALALAPTRELALQTLGAARPLAALYGLRSACVYGGVDKAPQAALLAKRPHILVATPGRLLDLLDDTVLSLDDVAFVVLDECDKMLSLGFAAQLQRLSDILLKDRAADEIVGGVGAPRPSQSPSKARQHGDTAATSVRKSRKRAREAATDVVLVPTAGSTTQPRPQMLLFTATLPDSVRSHTEGWVRKDCARVAVAASALSISTTITQVVQVCAEHKKPAKLLKHLKAVHDAAQGARTLPRVLVFANRVKTVKYLHEELAKEAYKVVCLHGECRQSEREAAVRDFKAGKRNVLVATDVAARGLHVRGLPYIVNYDFPSNLDTYIHRVGRTGRLQAHGHAFSFFTRNLVRLAPDLVDILLQHGQAVDPNLLRLREAYQTIVDKLGAEGAAAALKGGAVNGGAAEAEGEEAGTRAEEAELVAEDVLEGLVVLHELLGQRGKRRKGRHTVTREEASLPCSGSTQMQEEFVPSTYFTGSRVGYVFKRGESGLGYYKDRPPKATVRRKTAASELPKQARKGGILGPAPNQGFIDEASDEDDTPRVHVSLTHSTGKRKALPGRLRKKLAKEKVAQG